MKDQLPQIIKAQQGDTQALNRLFTWWYRDVYNIAFRYFSDADLAGEATQQSFIIVQHKLSQLKDPAAFRVWLYRTVLNQCHSLSRKGQTRKRIEAAYVRSKGEQLTPGPEAAFQLEERARLVLTALQQLPVEQRVVLIMKEYEGLTFREIAEVLDASENTVKSRLYYGLKAMRKFFLTMDIKTEIYHDR